MWTHVSVKEIAELYSARRAFLSKHTIVPLFCNKADWGPVRTDSLPINHKNLDVHAGALLFNVSKSMSGAALDYESSTKWSTTASGFPAAKPVLPRPAQIVQIARL
jgi:hypothetical protein